MSEFSESISQAYESQKHLLPGGQLSSVSELRLAAIKKASRLGLPSLRDERWKYTKLGNLGHKEQFQLAESSDDQALKAEIKSQAPKFAATRLVFVDGYFVASLSDTQNFGNGISFQQVSTLLDNGNPETFEHLKNATLPDGVFTELNSTFLQDGAVIDIAKGQQTDPIEVLFVDTGRAKLLPARLIVRAAENSQSEIVETYISLKQSECLVNAVTEIHAKDAARVTHYRAQLDRSAHHIGHVGIHVAKDATVSTMSAVLGGNLTRLDLDAYLQGKGGHVNMDGLFVARNEQHIDHHTRINHLAPHTTSDENFKGIADNQGRGVFNGKIYVKEQAQKIAATQSSNNLLLSNDAEIDTKPELEIYADDVQCAHGATVGQLLDDELFYLRSRGIDERQARSMLTIAFADEVLDRIGNEALRSHIEQRVSATLAR